MRKAPILLATLAASLVLSACARNPDRISATYSSPLQYDNYNCSQLSAEGARLSAQAAKLSGVQQKRATGDAVATGVAVVLFWPALFFIKGDKENAANLAQVRGQMNALEQAAIAKQCGIRFDRG